MSDRLEEIRKRVEAASPGPWTGDRGSVEPRPLCVRAPVRINAMTDIVATVTRHETDCDFIAHARDDIPWLLAQLATARDAALEEAADCALEHEGDFSGIPLYNRIMALKEKGR